MFDLDDTLYDQFVPFNKAMLYIFPKLEVKSLDVFMESRRLSDQVFHDTETKKIKMDEMHIFRIQKALQKWDIKINDDQALEFQKKYEEYQKEIDLHPKIELILNELVKNSYTLGVISNGKSSRQQSKVRTLNLTKWIDPDNIIISDEVAVSKPNPKIFKILQKKLNADNNECLYIGDSFLNDVVGSYKAGWTSLWFNHRKRKEGLDSKYYRYYCESFESLYNFMKKFS